MRQAQGCVSAPKGVAYVSRTARFGERLDLDPHQFNVGENDPDRDFPKYARLVAEQKVDLTPLTSSVYPLSRVNAALDDLEAGRAMRALLEPTA